MTKQPTYGSATTRRLWARRAVACALCAVALGLGFAQRPNASAEPNAEYVVIVHAKNPITFTTRSLLSAMFLKRTVRWPDGEAVRPADLHSDSPVRQLFSEDVLQRSVVAVRRYWQQRIFSGRELPPPELDADQAVLQFVENTRGAIGYVSSRAKLTTNVKVVPIRAD